MTIVLQIAEVIAAFVFFYLRFFLYETEQGKLQSSLEELWIRIDDCSSSARSKTRRFLDEVLAISQRFFDFVFGADLLSWRSAGVSLCFALSGICFSLMAVIVAADVKPNDPVTVAGGLCTAAIFFLIGCLPMLITKAWSAAIAILCPTIFLTAFPLLFAGRPIDMTDLTEPLIHLLVAMLLAVPLDIAWVMGNRFLLKTAQQRRGSGSKVFALLAGLAVTIGLLALRPDVSYFNRVATSMLDALIFVAFLMGFSRLFLIGIALVQAACGAVVVLHRVFWPLLSRVVYACQRYQVFKERKFFGSIGAVLLAHALGGVEWISALLKALARG